MVIRIVTIDAKGHFVQKKWQKRFYSYWVMLLNCIIGEVIVCNGGNSICTDAFY